MGRRVNKCPNCKGNLVTTRLEVRLRCKGCNSMFERVDRLHYAYPKVGKELI